MQFFVLLIWFAVPTCHSDYAGSSTDTCEPDCLNNFDQYLSGISDQDQACEAVSSYMNCLQTTCTLSDLTPYISPLQQLMASHGFTCDLSNVISGDETAVSDNCETNCLSSYQSQLAASTEQSGACEAANTYLDCVQSVCNLPLSSFVTDTEHGLVESGYTTCDLSGFSTISSSNDGPSSGSSTLPASHLTALGALLLEAVMRVFCRTDC